MGKFIDLTGLKFNEWTVLYKASGTKWICKCSCGTIRSVDAYNLRSNKSKSCGCLGTNPPVKHGETGTRFHNIWMGIKRRCLNPNATHYEYYGGKGITICDRWMEYLNFREDMYPSYINHVNQYGEKDTTLDRNNSDGNYCPDNCKWATLKEQECGKIYKHQKLFEATYILPGPSFGYVEQSNNQHEFCRKYGLTRTAVNACLNGRGKHHKGWSFKFL
jgi:hypothetical protein